MNLFSTFPLGGLPRFVLLSAGFHFCLLGSQHLLGHAYSVPMYAVEESLSGVEVSLIKEYISNQPQTQEQPQNILTAVKESPSGAQEPVSAIKKEIENEIPPLAGSSRKGALTQAKPDYLRNPSPRYPYQARRDGREGLVLLQVDISKDGRSLSVAVKQSSGHEILDEEAVRAVKRWFFQPAKIAGIAVESSALVPIKFTLKSFDRG